MSNEKRKEYETPVLTQVGAADDLILGGTAGVPDQPLDPPTRLNGDMDFGLDE